MFCFVLQRTPTNENNSGTEWQGIQQLLPCLKTTNSPWLLFFDFSQSVKSDANEAREGNGTSAQTARTEPISIEQAGKLCGSD